LTAGCRSDRISTAIKDAGGNKMNGLGKSLVIIFGIINLLLVIFQVSTGKRWLKVNFKWHRRLGVVLLITAIIHAVLADLAL
jgi:steroid 5-alpha reductase family enzyme